MSSIIVLIPIFLNKVLVKLQKDKGLVPVHRLLRAEARITEEDRHSNTQIITTKKRLKPHIMVRLKVLNIQYRMRVVRAKVSPLQG